MLTGFETCKVYHLLSPAQDVTARLNTKLLIRPNRNAYTRSLPTIRVKNIMNQLVKKYLERNHLMIFFSRSDSRTISCRSESDSLLMTSIFMAKNQTPFWFST